MQKNKRIKKRTLVGALALVVLLAVGIAVPLAMQSTAATNYLTKAAGSGDTNAANAIAAAFDNGDTLRAAQLFADNYHTTITDGDKGVVTRTQKLRIGHREAMGTAPPYDNGSGTVSSRGSWDILDDNNIAYNKGNVNPPVNYTASNPYSLTGSVGAVEWAEYDSPNNPRTPGVRPGLVNGLYGLVATDYFKMIQALTGTDVRSVFNEEPLSSGSGAAAAGISPGTSGYTRLITVNNNLMTEKMAGVGYLYYTRFVEWGGTGNGTNPTAATRTTATKWNQDRANNEFDTQAGKVNPLNWSTTTATDGNSSIKTPAQSKSFTRSIFTALKEFDTIADIPDNIPLSGKLTISYGRYNSGHWQGTQGTTAAGDTSFVAYNGSNTADQDGALFGYITDYLAAKAFTPGDVKDTTDIVATLTALANDPDWGTSGVLTTALNAQALIDTYDCVQLKIWNDMYVGAIEALIDADSTLSEADAKVLITKYVADIHAAGQKAKDAYAGRVTHSGPTANINVTLPTCVAAGKHDVQCVNCKDTLEQNVVDAIDPGNHKNQTTGIAYGTPSRVKIAATCAATGQNAIYCDGCDAELSLGTTIPKDAANHDGNEVDVVTLAATCAATGLKNIKCDGCDGILRTGETVAKDAANHDGNEVDVVTLAATCAATGLKNIKCDGCDGILRTGETVAKNPANHDGNEVDVVTLAATCAATGLKNVKCDGCDGILRTGETVAKDPANHDGGTKFEETLAATCIAAGTKDKICLGCTEILEADIAIAIDAGNHVGNTYEKVITAAKCALAGELGIYCEDCDALLDTDGIAATGNHTGNIAATCTTAKTCIDCGFLMEAKNAANHAGGTDKNVIKAATCGAAGETGLSCKGCGAPTGKEVVPATGKHTANIPAATCKTAKVCTVCATQLEAKNPGNHAGAVEKNPLKAATCGAAGEMGIYCKDCGVLTGKEVIAKSTTHTGGTYDSVITAATSSKAGSMGTYCKTCNALLKTTPIPATGKDGLKDVYDEYKNLNKDDYTDASWKKFKDALDVAKKVLDNPNASKADVDKALKDLKQAQKDLVKKVKEVVLTGPDGKPLEGNTIKLQYKRSITLTTDQPVDFTTDSATRSGKKVKVEQPDTQSVKLTSTRSFFWKSGTATIQAKAGDVTATFEVVVKPVWWQYLIIILLFGWIWY